MKEQRQNYQRLLSNIYESIKEKEFLLRRQPVLSSFGEEAPLPRLKPPIREVRQARSAFRTLDDDRRDDNQTAKNNMRLLGLSVQRVNYSSKLRVDHLQTEEPQLVTYQRVTRAKSTTKASKTARELPFKEPLLKEVLHPIYESRLHSYRELLFQVNFTYGVMREARQAKYTAWVGLGNNGNLIKGLLKRRFWWSLLEERNDSNFLWTQLKSNEYFAKQQRQPQSLPLLRKTHKKHILSKIMSEGEIQIFLKHNHNKEYQERAKALHLRKQFNEGFKMHNHLPNNFHLGNKKALFFNLKHYHELMGSNVFKSVPLTFHIKKGIRDPQYKRFVAYFKKRASFKKGEQKMRNVWIVKPGQLTNRGNGITVIDEVYELDAIIRAEATHQNGQSKTFIVQLYIDCPLLYKRRKFDLRHYMLISQINGVLKAYWYSQGYVRTASYEFDIDNFEREIHLTNDAIQKYTPLYGKYQPANKLSYAELQRYLDITYPKANYNLANQILPRMKEIALEAVKSTFFKLAPERLAHNFQIFGLDFMIDSDFKPWLIEINTNPCLELACPLLSRIIPQMVDQALRLTLDVVCPPPSHYPNTAKHLVPDADLNALKFDLFFDERLEGETLLQLYKKARPALEDIGIIEDDEVFEDQGKDIILDQLL